MSVQCPLSEVDQTSRRKAATSVFDPGCVKTSTRGKRAELFSPFSSFYGACQGDSFLIPRYRDKRSTRKFDVGVFTQPGSKTVLAVPKVHFRSTPNNRHQQTARIVRSVPKRKY